MEEIGIKLKQRRIENGVTLEEAAEDLKINTENLKNIEDGKKDDFKDVLSLKNFIKDYAKYLGLDGEELLDDFNEVLFEQTSKISVEDINTAIKEKEEREKDLKILSPYTTKKKKKGNIYIIIGTIVLILILVLVGYILLNNK
jgi:cytoskeletal protein RodZ